MEKDREDIEFEALLNEKRHGEIKTALDTIAKILASSNNSDVIVQTKKLSQVVELLQNLIAVNNKGVIDTYPIQRACEEVVKSNERLIEAIENRLVPDTFDIIRDNNGVKTVRVNYAPANEMITI